MSPCHLTPGTCGRGASLRGFGSKNATAHSEIFCGFLRGFFMLFSTAYGLPKSLKICCYKSTKKSKHQSSPLEAHGVRVAVLGSIGPSTGNSLGRAFEVEPLRHMDVIVMQRLIPGGLSSPSPSANQLGVPDLLPGLVKEVMSALTLRQNVLIPLDGDNLLALGLPIIEAVGHGIAACTCYEAQAPIYAVGGLVSFLRRCVCFGEWAQEEKLAMAHRGEKLSAPRNRAICDFKPGSMDAIAS